jgi:hypothetical protein
MTEERMSASGARFLVLALSQVDERAAGEMLEYLRDTGETDFFVLSSGKHKGRISVGYGDRIYAKQRRVRMRRISIDVEVVRMSGKAPQYRAATDKVSPLAIAVGESSRRKNEASLTAVPDGTGAYTVFAVNEVDELAAQVLLDYLADLGISGASLVTNSRHESRISLGSFENEIHALERQLSLSAVIEVEVLETGTPSAGYAPAPVVEESSKQTIETTSVIKVTPQPEVLTSRALSTSALSKSIDYPTVCFSVGPLTTKTAITLLLGSLTKLKNASEFAVDETISTLSSEFLVLAVEQPHVAATVSMIKDMRRAGIEGVYIVREGDHKGRIALGPYENEAYAFDRRERFVIFGVDSQLLEIENKTSSFWLNLSLRDDLDAKAELMGAVASFDPGTNVYHTDCSTLKFVAR